MHNEETNKTEDIEIDEGYDQKGAEEEDHNGPDDDTMDYIKSSLKSVDNTDNEQEEESEEEENQNESEEEIDSDFIDAAREAGWKDDEIQEFSSNYSNQELVDMIPHLLIKEETEDEIVNSSSTINEETNKESNEKTSINLDDIEDEKIKEIIERMEKRNQDLENRINASDKERQELDEEKYQQTLINNCVKANDIFDEIDSEVFGKTDQLPRFPNGGLVPTSPQFKAREEVFGKAHQFHEKLDMPWENAVRDAIKLLNGNSEKEAGRKLVRQLKEQSKNLSPKRTKKSVEKQYRDEDEEKADVVRQIAREAGVDLN